MLYKRQYGGKKTKEQKDNAFDKFLKDSKRKKCSDRIQSADGKYSTWGVNLYFFHEKKIVKNVGIHACLPKSLNPSHLSRRCSDLL
jgi:hypothetical protein